MNGLLAAAMPTEAGYYWVRIVVHRFPNDVNWELMRVYSSGENDIPEWDSEYQTVVEVLPRIAQPDDPR
jgi:hypothetical protein